MIYLASPYSHHDPSVRLRRFEQVCAFAAQLMRDGKHVFSPIAHTHPIAMAGELPTNWLFWEKYDRAVLKMCDEMIVLKLCGWEDSKGIAAEIEIAREMGMTIAFVEHPSK